MGIRPARRRRHARDNSDLIVTAVLSGNRNFESRIHPLAKTIREPARGRMRRSVLVDLTRALGVDRKARPCSCATSGGQREVGAAIDRLSTQAYRDRYAKGFSGSAAWRRCPPRVISASIDERVPTPSSAVFEACRGGSLRHSGARVPPCWPTA
jgi:hypothetical protein